MIVRSLLRRVLRNPVLSDRYHDTRVVELRARPVMEAVADLVVDAASPKAASNKRNSMYSVGPKRAGESEADFAERKAAKRERVDASLRAQGHLRLPIAGGKPSEANGSQVASPAANQDGGPVGFDWEGRVASPARGSSNAAVAADDLQDSRESTAAAAASPDSARVSLASTEAKPEKPNGLALASPEATALASEAAAQWRWDPAHAAAAPGIIQSYLAAGYSPTQIRTVMAERRDATCSGARYLGKPLARLRPERGAAAKQDSSFGPAAAPLPAINPEVAGDEVWGKLPGRIQRDIGLILDGLQLPPGQGRDKAISAARSYRQEGLAALLSRRPDLAGQLGVDRAA